jgi:hypothetical protein
MSGLRIVFHKCFISIFIVMQFVSTFRENLPSGCVPFHVLVVLRVFINVLPMYQITLTTRYTHLISKDKVQPECDVPASKFILCHHIDETDADCRLFINSCGFGRMVSSSSELLLKLWISLRIWHDSLGWSSARRKLCACTGQLNVCRRRLSMHASRGTRTGSPSVPRPRARGDWNRHRVSLRVRKPWIIIYD